MEQVLDVYKRPYDPDFPVVCLDESPKQLIGEKELPFPMKKGQPQKVDYEYTRYGMCQIFMVNEPLAGKRMPVVTERKTKQDWAKVMEGIAEHYSHAKKITVVMDNLNTHKYGSLYSTFPPTLAKKLMDKIDIVYTPKHGSWLNMAEIELNVLTMQCLNRRIKTRKEMEHEVHAWAVNRNNQNQTINWQFTTDQARIKLKRLYPKNNA